MNAQSHGISNRRWPATALAATSKRQGISATLNTVTDSFRRATGSNPSPALNRITVRAVFLQKRTNIEELSTHERWFNLIDESLQLVYWSENPCAGHGFEVKLT